MCVCSCYLVEGFIGGGNYGLWIDCVSGCLSVLIAVENKAYFGREAWF